MVFGWWVEWWSIRDGNTRRRIFKVGLIFARPKFTALRITLDCWDFICVWKCLSGGWFAVVETAHRSWNASAAVFLRSVGGTNISFNWITHCIQMLSSRTLAAHSAIICPVRLLSVENGHSLGVCLPGYGDPVPKTPIVLCAVRLCAYWKPTRAQSPPCLPGRSLRCWPPSFTLWIWQDPGDWSGRRRSVFERRRAFLSTVAWWVLLVGLLMLTDRQCAVMKGALHLVVHLVVHLFVDSFVFSYHLEVDVHFIYSQCNRFWDHCLYDINVIISERCVFGKHISLLRI